MISSAAPQVVDVAEQILQDIRRRKLQPGDSYPGTAETAKSLRISGSTVNRAMQLLARRGVVQRRQRSGTSILDPLGKSPPGLERVHLLVREDHLRAEGLWADGVLLGLQQALPGVQLQFNFKPEAAEGDYVQGLIDDILRSRQSAGLVLIRASAATQRLVAASGLSAVISGTPAPSVTTLPSVDRDQRQIGALLAGHLLQRRCRTFLLLFRERMTAGDHVMLDAALQTLAAAEIPLNRVLLRFLPSDPASIVAESLGLLHRAPGKIGCLCRSERLASGFGAALESLAGTRRRAEIVVADAARQRTPNLPYPCIEPDLPAEDWGAALGKLLLNAAQGKEPPPPQIIPVHLRLPRGK